MQIVELVRQEIMQLYRFDGDSDYIGESVSQLEHMYQMACLAEDAGYDEEVILAAFFHDIGHLVQETGSFGSMDGYGTEEHEILGADYLLSKGFSERLVQLVKSHVEAKRYLVYADHSYFESLSPASRRTLQFQGGGMTGEEANIFEQDPQFELKVQFRRWDDAAKQIGIPVVDWERFGDMIVRHLQRQIADN
jgi:phosphonate degradation associated HDIG domain protein